MIVSSEPAHRMNCPKCGKGTAHRSHRTQLDWIISSIGYKPYRCKECQHRFYAYRDGETSPRLRTPEERRILKTRRGIKWRRTKTTLLLYFIGAIIFLGILYYILIQRVPPDTY